MLGEHVVDEHHPIAGVIDDVGDLLVEEPHVDRVEHGTHERHRPVELEVASRVVGEGGDPVAGTHAEVVGEHAAQPQHPLRELAIGATPLGIDHLGIGVHRAHALEDRSQRERRRLHESGQGHRLLRSCPSAVPRRQARDASARAASVDPVVAPSMRPTPRCSASRC